MDKLYSGHLNFGLRVSEDSLLPGRGDFLLIRLLERVLLS
mgnify:FL=1